MLTAALLMTSSHSEGPPPSGCKLAWNIFKGVISNPIVFMTFFGLMFNFIFKSMPPSVMLMPFEMLSKTFGGLALTALGMSMANKLFFLKGQALLSATCLIFAKTIMLPLIAKVMVSGRSKTPPSWQPRICSRTLMGCSDPPPFPLQ